MKQIFINKQAKIIDGVCKDIVGKVIAYDSVTGEVTILPDWDTKITVTAYNVTQEDLI